MAGKAAVSHDYEAKNGNLLKSTYANGWEVTYTYDNLDRVTEVKASKDGSCYLIGRYIYDKLGRIARFVDGQVSGKSCTYGYDLTDRLCEAVFDDGTAYRYTYDANDCLVKEVQTTPDGVRTVTRGYDADSRETAVACGSAKVEKTFDKLGRLSSIRRNGGKHTTAYTYETASDGGQTGRIKTVKNGSGTWEYAYDAWGNVSKATENGSADSHTYTYDDQGQLTREYDPDKKLYLGYQYDAGGNLTEVRSYPAGAEGGPEGTGTVLKTFAYDSTWKDQLASVTMDGKTRNFTYDANGNLLNGGKYTYSWTKGSLLEKVTGDGLEAVYTYDASGIRTSKKVNGTTTEYLTAGGSVLSEKKNGVWQHYLYDGSGQLMAIRYKGADYYYIRDGLMTITGLVDANGVAVVNYRYDSWGILTGITGSMAGTLGKDNPYRFKGYYYDEETGMYYLKSRYYQPEICRFISADEPELTRITPMALTDKNLYAYCDNNPIVRRDMDGALWGFVLAGAAVGAAIGAATQVIDNAISGRELGDGVLLAAVGGAITGAVGATGLGALGQAYVSGAVAAATDVITQVKESGKGMQGVKDIDWMQVNVSFTLGAVSGARGGNGLLHKGSEVTKARKIYQRAIKGIRERRWSTSKAAGYLVRSSRNLKKVVSANYKKAGRTSFRMSMVTMVLKKVIPLF
ncbi:MAG: RHS repeat-associated core domain-containing protein [Coprococcus catus]